MKYLLPLLLLSVVPGVRAANMEASHQLLMADQHLTAQVIGARRPQSVENADVLVFDSNTGADGYATSDASPRTFQGMPFNLDGVLGSDPMISKVVVYLAYTGAQAQLYNSLNVRLQFWDTWEGDSSPVFSNPVGLVIEGAVSGPFTLNPSTITPINFPLDPPVPLSGLTGNGITINFQGDTGAGAASSDNLTSVVRYGANSLALGANPLAAGYGYRNVSGQTDFNFVPTDAETFGAMNEAMALKLFASGTPNHGPMVQDGGFEAGPAATYWGQSSTNFDGVICDASCAFIPHTGTSYVWFGGTKAAEVSAVEQSGVIIAAGPGAGPKELNFYLWWASGVVTSPDPNAYFKVMIDGNTIFSITPATASAYYPDYAPVSLDISAYADGATHTLRFEENNAAASAPTNILLDDISIVDDRVFASGFE